MSDPLCTMRGIYYRTKETHMGADFIIAGCPSPVDRNEQPITTATPEFIEMLRQRIRAVVATNPHALQGYYGMEDEEWLADGVTSLDTMVVDITALVNEWWDVRRDIAWRTIGEDPRLWLFTGGMTWGDDPSDSFSLIDFIDTFDLFDEPFDMDGGNG